MTNTLGIMLEILSIYRWTRLSVRIIGTIKRQFFHMVTHVLVIAISHKRFMPSTPGELYSTFTKLWQSCSDPHLKIRPIAIFAFYFLNYSLAALLQDASRPKSPTKVETKRKLQQFTVSGWLIMNGERKL